MTTFKQAAASALALAALLGTGATASAQDVYRPLTVGRHHAPAPDVYYRPAEPQFDPYRGQAVIVTGPVGLASAAVDLPFRAFAAVFPYEGNSPLVLIGAPVAAAGRLAQLPFRIAQAPFGGPNPFQY